MKNSTNRNNWNGEIFRTYKAGLRVPESLLVDFNTLMKRQQVLRFLYKKHLGKINEKHLRKFEKISKKFNNPRIRAHEEFKIFNNFQNASENVLVKYKLIFNECYNSSLSQVKIDLNQINEDIAILKIQDSRLNSREFKREDIPTFKDVANPRPSEISLHDYQSNANRSVKLICTHLNNFAVNNIDKLPETRDELITIAMKKTKMSHDSLARYPYKAASAFLGTGRNMDQIALEQMTSMMEVYRDMKGKVKRVKELLYQDNDETLNFSNVMPVLMTYYSISPHFLKYLARAWNVDLKWVRNTIIGWRRKIDPFLPLKFQIEQVSKLMKKVADYCRSWASSEDDIKKIGRLQKRHGTRG